MITPAYSLTANERVLPRLALDFTTGVLDARVTITRALNTATRINSAGFVEGVNANLPRFDYDPTTLVCKGLLIEETRTNLLTRSAEFNDAIWQKNAAGTGSAPSVTPNAAISPDGTQNADVVVFNKGAGTTTGDYSLLQQDATSTAVAHTNSIWLRTQSGTAQIAIRFPQTVTDPTSYQVVTVTTTWQRFPVSRTSAGTTVGMQLILRGTYGTSDSATLELYGAQLEVGAFATSYIPTTTTSLTRNADAVTMTGTNFSSWYNASEGTFAVRGSTLTTINPAVPAFLAVSDGTNLNYAAIFADNSLGRPQFAVFVNGNAQCDLFNFAFSNTANTPFGAAAAYKLNDFAMSTNGLSVNLDSLGSMPTVDRMGIGCRHGNSRFLNGHIQKINYWPQRTINNEVQAFAK